MQKINHGKALIKAIAVICAAGLAATHAHAEDDYCKQDVDQHKSTDAELPEGTPLYDCSGWYLGVGLGVSNIKPRIVNLPETLDQTRDIVLPTVFLGYDLTKHWSLEAQYSNQGQATFESGAAIDYSHLGASVLYHVGTHLPGWHAYGKLGVGRLDTSLAQGRDDGGVFNYEQLKSTQLHLGAGIGYMTRSMWGVRLEALSVDKDSKELTLSLVKRFGRDAGKTRALVAPPAPVIVKAEPKPKPVAPKILCEAPKGVLEGIYFVTASARLTEASQKVLDGVIAELLPFPNIQIAVRAHTDSRGSEAYNLNLSNLRAASVKEYLQSHGVLNVQSQGYGESQPIGDNNTQEGLAQNRRVEVEVLSDECAS